MNRSKVNIFPNEQHGCAVFPRHHFRFCRRLSSDNDDGPGVSQSTPKRHKLRTGSDAVAGNEVAQFLHVELLLRAVSPEGLGFAVRLMDRYQGPGDVNDGHILPYSHHHEVVVVASPRDDHVGQLFPRKLVHPANDEIVHG